MQARFKDFVRRRREALGITQRELARRSQVKQPLIAAIESGLRQPSASALSALSAALALRPSRALAAWKTEVQELFERRGLPPPRVFGSVARGVDKEDSDLDLLVEFGAAHDIADLLALEEELEALLTVETDIVDASSAGAVAELARSESVPL